MSPTEFSVQSGPDPSNFPDLNPNALQSLTQKIQQNLSKGGKSSPKTLPGEGAQGKRQKKKEKKEKKQTLDNAVVALREGDQHAPLKTVKGGSILGQKLVHGQQSKQGSKRLRNGDLKHSHGSDSKQKSSKDASSVGPSKQEPGAQGDLGIREEIRALGGTDEDYELIADVLSESEYEGPQEKDKGNFTNEVERFLTGLGIQNVRDDDSAVYSDDEMGQEGPINTGRPIQNGQADSVKDVIEAKGRRYDLLTAKQNSKSQGNLLIEPLSEWHAVELSPLPTPTAGQKALPMDVIERLQTHAKSLLDKENQAYADTQRFASSTHQFYSTIMSTGTLSDKIGALTLSVQQSPVHTMKALESLVGLARKRSRDQAVEVLGALKDLFGAGNLLPSSRKLQPFAGHPELHAVFSGYHQWTDEKRLPKPLNEAHLIHWAYEDWLKSIFFQTLQIMETWSNDEVVFARGKAVDYVFSLLKDKPEQEANLLRLLVNKLGDTDKKVASKTSYHILQLETAHPAMKPTVTSAIESDLLFRPNQSLHAQYYAVITLNQTVLSDREEDLARKLISIYFALFLKLLNDKPEKAELATDDKVAKKAVTLNRKGEVQGGGSAPGKTALKKKASQMKSTVAEEELREKMIAALLTGVNRAIPYISTNDETFEKHLDTLFRVTHSSNFNTSVQALMLIQQIQGSNQSNVDRFYRTLYESLLDPRLLRSSKQVLYLNLLYRSLRTDLNVDRIKAFAKRILQVVAMHQPSFTCGAIYLIRELESIFPGLQAFVDQPEGDAMDDEETFRDIPDNISDASLPTPRQPNKPSRSNLRYDPRKRDPLHANASASALWDVHPLTHHYHPSVSLFATRFLDHNPMPPKPDLGLNTLIHFLDRFVYKNPKTSITKKGTMKGASLMQPLAGGNKSAILVSKAGQTGGEGPVNAEGFWKKEVGKIGADEVFFHKYFSEVGRKKEKRSEKRAKKESKKQGMDTGVSDEESEEEEEEEIWKALVGSKPEILGDDEGIDEDELEGYDDEDGDVDMEHGADDVGVVDPGDADGFPAFSDDEDDALVDSDGEVPDGVDLGGAFGGAVEDVDKEVGVKGKVAGKNDARKEKKRRLKSLPMFASVDDYEKVLGGDEEEGVA